MARELSDQIETYVVLVNREEQHSLWLARKAIPAGWQKVGPTGSKAECLEYIETVWSDIAPLSVRQRLQSGARK